MCKRNTALASVEREHAAIGTRLAAEIWHNKELKIERVEAACRVVERRFYDPPHRKE